MNVKKRLEHVATALGAARRVGKSTLVARACKDLDGVLLCANNEQATLLKHQHGVNTRSVQTNLQGIMGPFFIDHYATEQLLNSGARKIEELEATIKELESKNMGLEHAIVDMQLVLTKLEKEVML